ncbi:hypothetical protein DERF_012926 [Dermatophagoides farinae]|uniref:Uncharacterized protein n=1 Tax=Dermatophagoides farinae TaxID=6954 RepID=A0A922HQH9_DERFA|nr:hypothetical protein DERF_012926 [Dermatophagoides farinae]
MSSKSFNTCRTNNHHQAKKSALQQQLTAFQHHQQPSHFPVFTSATSHPTLSNYQPPQSQYATTSYLHQFHNLNKFRDVIQCCALLVQCINKYQIDFCVPIILVVFCVVLRVHVVLCVHLEFIFISSIQLSYQLDI